MTILITIHHLPYHYKSGAEWRVSATRRRYSSVATLREFKPDTFTYGTVHHSMSERS